MTNNVIIVGNGQTAELALWYLRNDSPFNVVAFTVDSKYITTDTYLGLPVVPFEDVQNIYNTNENSLFAPMQGSKMNNIRKGFFEKGKAKNFKFISYISSKATVLTDTIGSNCFILEDNTLQPFTTIGDNVVMWSGNHIGHHSIIEDHVFVASHVVVSGRCTVKQRAYLGVNSCIKDGLIIGEGCLVGMGAVITKNTEANTLYIGTASTPHKIKADKVM